MLAAMLKPSAKCWTRVAKPDSAGQNLLTDAAHLMLLTVRGYYRLWRVAQTIADPAGAASVNPGHIAEALCDRHIAQANG